MTRPGHPIDRGRTRGRVVVALLVSALAACEGRSVTPEPAARTTDARPSEPPASAATASSSGAGSTIVGRPIDGATANPARRERSAEGESRYSLEVVTAPVVVDAPAQVDFVVRPRGEWHLNLDYETVLTVDPPPGVAIERPRLRRRDALAFGEDRLEFALTFVALEPGELRLAGELRFALCRAEELCTVVVEALDVAVAARRESSFPGVDHARR